MRNSSGRGIRVAGTLLLAAMLMSLSVGVMAQEEAPAGEGSAEPELVQLGFTTYTNQCAGCHQASGTGISGTFPPLSGNPNVQDTEYLTTTIRNGRAGPLVVAGVDYDGVMPAFPTLSDEEVDGLVAFIQGGFAVPGGGGDDTAAELPVATGTLPELSGMAITAAFAIAAGAAALVLGPRIVGTIDRMNVPWLDAWLRAVLIVGFFVVATVVVPSMILQTETVSRLDRVVQDVIGAGLWFGGLAVGLLALWYAHREGRV